MAFRIDGLAKAYQKAQNAAYSLRTYCVSAEVALASSNQSANAVIALLNQIVNAITIFDEVAAIPGLAAYAQEQQNDSGYDVIAEFQTMRAEAVGVRDWIITNFPKDSTNTYIIKDILENDGSITVRQFTPAQTAGLRSALNLLIGTISEV